MSFESNRMSRNFEEREALIMVSLKDIEITEGSVGVCGKVNDKTLFL